jgi:hypothetical protein
VLPAICLLTNKFIIPEVSDKISSLLFSVFLVEFYTRV